MDRELIEKYRREMLDTYRARPISSESTSAQVQSEFTVPEPEPIIQETTLIPQPETDQNAGRLIAIVTSLRSLYPVKGARVTVFTGSPDNKTVVATDVTDQSGRTGTFILPTPAKQLSLEAGSPTLPYAQYNMLVEAEGYLDTLHLNIPVFSGVTSLQQSNLLLLETSGVDKSPQVFDEAQQFGL